MDLVQENSTDHNYNHLQSKTLRNNNFFQLMEMQCDSTRESKYCHAKGEYTKRITYNLFCKGRGGVIFRGH